MLLLVLNHKCVLYNIQARTHASTYIYIQKHTRTYTNTHYYRLTVLLFPIIKHCIYPRENLFSIFHGAPFNMVTDQFLINLPFARFNLSYNLISTKSSWQVNNISWIRFDPSFEIFGNAQSYDIIQSDDFLCTLSADLHQRNNLHEYNNNNNNGYYVYWRVLIRQLRYNDLKNNDYRLSKLTNI